VAMPVNHTPTQRKILQFIADGGERGRTIVQTARRKNKQTQKTERANIKFPLWRKKVDNSIFRDLGTTVPNWVCDLWDFDSRISRTFEIK
jgi:hypothetical protein